MLLVGLSQVMGYSVAGPSISVLAKTMQVLLRKSVPTVLSSWSLGCDCLPADLERRASSLSTDGETAAVPEGGTAAVAEGDDVLTTRQETSMPSEQK